MHAVKFPSLLGKPDAGLVFIDLSPWNQFVLDVTSEWSSILDRNKIIYILFSCKDDSNDNMGIQQIFFELD